MIREELRRALEVLGDLLPGGEAVILARRASGDRSIILLRGEVEKVTGHPPSSLEGGGSGWLEAVHPADREGVRAALQDLPDRDRLRLEYRLVQPDGEARWMKESLQVLRRPGDALPGVVGVLRDVSELRELRRRVSALEDRLWRSQRLESLGSLAGGVAHDFNNLLTAIHSSARFLREDLELSSESEADLQVILDAAERGGALVRQILSYASRDSGEPDVLDLGRLVDDLERILRRTIGGDVEFHLERDEELWPVHGARGRLEQVVLNLVVNARDAMPDGGELSVEVRNEELESPRSAQGDVVEPGRYVRLSIRDTGKGIAPESRERIFEPFFSTKGEEDVGGRGLGLPLVLQVIRSHGGAVQVESEVERGTVFHAYLPVRERSATPKLPEARAAEALSGTGGLRVLVVEDDPAVRELVRRALEEDGHGVAEVPSAGEAIRVFDRTRPAFDLCVIDLGLPDREGGDLAQALRRREPGLAVLLVSGREPRSGSSSLREDVRTGFLKKPFTLDQLREAVSRILSRSRPLAGDAEGGEEDAAS